MKTNKALNFKSQTNGLPINLGTAFFNDVSTGSTYFRDAPAVIRLNKYSGTEYMILPSFTDTNAVQVYGPSGSVQHIALSTYRDKLGVDKDGNITKITNLIYSGTGNVNLSQAMFYNAFPVLVIAKAYGSTPMGFSSGESGTPGSLCPCALVFRVDNTTGWFVYPHNGTPTNYSPQIFVRPTSSNTVINIYSLL